MHSSPDEGAAHARGGTGDTEVSIRRITDAASVRDAAELFDGPPDDAATELFLSRGHHLLLAYDGSKPVGMVTGIEMVHPDKGTEMFLYELGVAETHRGRGIGTMLVSALKSLAQQHGCYGMWVLADDPNAAALNTYEAAGGKRQANPVLFDWELGSG